jgi:hypothetical protein
MLLITFIHNVYTGISLSDRSRNGMIAKKS